MKAWVLHDAGDIRYEEVPVPEPAAGEVLIRVGAVGICGSDIPRIYDTGAHKMPLIPGHEFSGEVAGTGEGVDKSWTGKRVGVFPLIPCGKCSQCKAGRYELCRDYDYIGSRRDGAFAEFVTAPAANLIELPDKISFEEAGYDNLILIGNKDSQRKKIISMGIFEDCYYDNAIEMDNGGADIVFECVGRTETYAKTIDIAAPMGKVMLVGNPYSDMTLPRNIYWKILRNQLTVMGTWNSSFTGDPDDDWHYVLNLLGSGLIEPARFISHRFKLKGLSEGLDIMREKREEYGKVIITQL